MKQEQVKEDGGYLRKSRAIANNFFRFHHNTTVFSCWYFSPTHDFSPMENADKTQDASGPPYMRRSDFFGMLDLICEILANENCHISRFTEKTPSDILQGRHILFKPVLFQKSWSLSFCVKGKEGVWVLVAAPDSPQSFQQLVRYRGSSLDMIAFSSQPASPPMTMIFASDIVNSLSYIPEVSLFGVIYALCLSNFPELYIFGQMTEKFDIKDFYTKQYPKLITLHRMSTGKVEPFSFNYLVKVASVHRKLTQKISKQNVLSAEWNLRAVTFLRMINSDIVNQDTTLTVIDAALDLVRCNFEGDLKTPPSPDRIIIAPLRQYVKLDDPALFFYSTQQIVLPFIHNDQTLLMINFKVKDNKTFDTRVLEVCPPKSSRSTGNLALVKALMGLFTRSSRCLPNPIKIEKYRLDLNPLLMATLTLYLAHHYSLYNDFTLNYLPQESTVATYGYYFTSCMKSIKKGDVAQFTQRVGKLLDIVDLSFGPVR